VASTVHQMIKFEHDKQKVIIHGEGDLSIYKDSPMPFVEANSAEVTLVYQYFDAVFVDRICEGHIMPGPQLSPAPVMVVNEC